MSHAQRRLYEADVKHTILQQYCREPLALYECLLAPLLTTHEHHLVREMLLPPSRVSQHRCARASRRGGLCRRHCLQRTPCLRHLS